MYFTVEERGCDDTLIAGNPFCSARGKCSLRILSMIKIVVIVFFRFGITVFVSRDTCTHIHTYTHKKT